MFISSSGRSLRTANHTLSVSQYELPQQQSGVEYEICVCERQLAVSLPGEMAVTAASCDWR